MSADPAAFVAMVPMRHHSARVPEKNFRVLAGRPLYAYILETLLQVDSVSTIVVDTDSPVIREGVARTYPQVRLLDRPEGLRDDRIPMNEIIAHDLSQIPGDFWLQTHSTNPLLTPKTIQAAVSAFLAARPEKDSLFTVTRLQARLWDGAGRPVNHDPTVLARTQDLEAFYLENSCLYLFDRTVFEERRNRIGARPMLFEIDPAEAWDIDEETDFEICEGLIAHRAAISTPSRPMISGAVAPGDRSGSS